jgi:GNAT superfamily N-acetyltransferase
MNPELKRITRAHDPLFDSVIEIYEESMPARERKPAHMVRRLPERDDYYVFALNARGRVAALNMVYRPPGADFALLEYMAVRAGWRGLGFGSDLYRQTVGQVRATGPVSFLIEVDSERDTTAVDRETRLSRKRFYRSLGARQVDGLNYLLPLWPNWTPPIMDLMIDADPPRVILDRAVLDHWIDGVFQGAYGREPHDPRIAEMLATVKNPARLM